MSNWQLTGRVRNKIKPIVENYINLLEEKEANKHPLELSNKGISPMQLKELLEELGYEDDGYDSNGWQHDFCQYMISSNYKNFAKRLCIDGCGMTFDLVLRSDVN